MPWVNDDELDERTTTLKDGPLDGRHVSRPVTKLRKVQHAQAFRLADEQQPWQPGMPENECRVKFAIYLWLVSDQRYGWVDFVTVRNEEELNQALAAVQ